jgi:hypothetical protein
MDEENKSLVVEKPPPRTKTVSEADVARQMARIGKR